MPTDTQHARHDNLLYKHTAPSNDHSAHVRTPSKCPLQTPINANDKKSGVCITKALCTRSQRSTVLYYTGCYKDTWPVHLRSKVISAVLQWLLQGHVALCTRGQRSTVLYYNGCYKDTWPCAPEVKGQQCCITMAATRTCGTEVKGQQCGIPMAACSVYTPQDILATLLLSPLLCGMEVSMMAACTHTRHTWTPIYTIHHQTVIGFLDTNHPPK